MSRCKFPGFRGYPLAILVLSGIILLWPGCRRAVGLQRLTGNILMLTYLDANMIAVAGKGGIVVVDTLASPLAGRLARRRIESAFPGRKIVCVINTHGHGDHTFGNQAFTGADIVGHRECEKWMRREFADPRQQRIRQKKSEFRDFKLTPPNRTFEDRMELRVGDMTVHLIYYGAAHSDGDILIWFPRQQLLCVGDLFFRRGFLNITYHRGPWFQGPWDVPRWIAVLSEVLDEGAVKYVVAGHGKPVPPRHVGWWRDYLRELWHGVRRAGEARLTLEEVYDRFSLERKFPFFKEMNFPLPPTGHHRRLIRRFRELINTGNREGNPLPTGI